MTVETSANTKTYTSDGIQTVFSFPYKIYDAADMHVFLNKSEILTGFTTTVAADFNSASVTLLTPAPATTEIVLYRDVPITQGTDLGQEDYLAEENIEKMSDKLTMICQQLLERIGRSILLPVGTALNIVLGTPSPLKFWRFNSDASAVEFVDINTSGLGILGPGTTGLNRPVLWNSTNGSLVKNATNDNGTAGMVWTSNGAAAEPSFQTAASGDYVLQPTQSGTWSNSGALSAAEYPVDCTSASILNLIAATGSRRRLKLYITTGTGLFTINRNGSDVIVNTTGAGGTTQLLMQGAYNMFLELQDIASGKWAIV